MRRLMQWSSLHPIATLALLVALSAGSLWPARRVRIETSIDNLMMRNDPEHAFHVQTREMFGSEAVALIYVEDADLFSPARLETLQEVVHELEGIEGVALAESLFSTTAMDRRDGTLDIHPLIDWPPQTREEADLLKQAALAHPAIRNLLVSPDATATCINLRINLHNGDSERLTGISDEIERVLSGHAKDFDRIAQLGRPYLINAQKEYILHDQRVVLPLAVAVLIATLLLVLRSFKGALLPLLSAGASILWTLGFMGLFDLPITHLTFMVPALLLVIGSTEDIHLLAEYRAGRREGLERSPAVRRMVLRMGAAVTFTALTTFAGFATIMATPVPVLRDFGLVASFGLLVNPLITFMLIPAYLSLFPDRAHLDRNKSGISKPERALLNGLGRLRRFPRTTLLIACIPCVMAGLYGAVRVRADNNIVGFFKPQSPIVSRMDRLAEKLSGGESFCIRIDAAEAGAFKQPENLRYVRELQQWLDQSGWIDRSVSVTDYLAYIHHAVTGSPEAFPESDRGVAEYLLMLHRSEIEPYLTSDARHLNLIVRHNVRSSRELMPLIETLRKHIEQTCPAGLTATVSGEMLLVNKAVDAIVRGQLRGIVVIVFLVALLLSILFRSIRIGCLALIPNLLPIGVQFGFMALAGIPLNTATSMAAAISVGLAVDDTIHLLLRFYAQDRRLAPSEAVALSLDQLLRPVLATSLSLSLGFLALRFSQFLPIADFGLLAAMVLMTALLADLVVTPTLLSMDCMHPTERGNPGEKSP